MTVVVFVVRTGDEVVVDLAHARRRRDIADRPLLLLLLAESTTTTTALAQSDVTSGDPPAPDRLRHRLVVSGPDRELEEETEAERRARWAKEWARNKHRQPARPHMSPLSPSSTRRPVLEIRYWERTPINLERKQTHMEMLDSCTGGRMTREEWILGTSLRNLHVELEPNIFPYETPLGVMHYTLWSRTYLEDVEIESFVESWLNQHRPKVTAWGWDPTNLQEGLSIDLFHVHVFLYEPGGGISTPAVVHQIDHNNNTSAHRAHLPLLD